MGFYVALVATIVHCGHHDKHCVPSAEQDYGADNARDKDGTSVVVKSVVVVIRDPLLSLWWRLANLEISERLCMCLTHSNKLGQQR